MHISNTSSKTNFTRAGILGLGLIGGSWARALKSLGSYVVASDIDARSRADALAAGVVDEAGDSPACFENCDLLLLCAPPSIVCQTLPALATANIGLITDVCSVKTPVMQAAQSLDNFIGGHPMAGSEQTGFAASNAQLFANAPYILCVPENCVLPPERVAAFENLLAQLGAKIFHMTANEHDAAVARVSHLPHAAAFALKQIAQAQPECLNIAGRGYADMTRIANASPTLWADIFSRSPELLPVLKEYIAELSRLEERLSGGAK